MAVIHVLDKHTAELIAAGEVVERPASAAKELLENAIDAGATQITMSIRRGGIEQIEISDNGSGIDPEYIDKAFLRHATSKIEKEADLEHIHTLGFRGEALASIASVSKVDVLTKTADGEYACHYRIDGGEPQGIEPGARPQGTTITVNQLFYNTPARMKFLKKDASEGTFVADAVMHAALSHPEIALRFVREGRQQFATPGDGKLLSAAYAVLGREFSRDLLEVSAGDKVYRVSGWVTPPRACRASRGAQYFYVNGRYVKNRTMMAAMESAYKGTLMQGKFPGGILTLTMPPELVDVNVHPAKTEIRFARDADIFEAVYRAVRAALATPGSGECRFEMEGSKADAVQGKPAAAPPEPETHFRNLSAAEYRAIGELTKPLTAQNLPAAKACNEVSQAGPVQLHQEREAYQSAALQEPSDSTASEQEIDILPEAVPQTAAPQEKAGHTANPLSALPPLGEDVAASETEPSAQNPDGQMSFAPDQDADELRYVGEAFKTYIITERGTELCLIDKHAAHERLLFEKLKENYGSVASQLLLVPVQVNLSAEEKQAVLQNLSLLAEAGVEAEDYGGSTVIVRAVPCDVSVDDVEDMMVELAAHLAAGGNDALREKTEWVLHSVACRAAIKAGDRSDPAELLSLAKRILDGTVPPFCPHGRPCVLKLTRKELEKQFGRLV
jgi:DNA mismatch repair protein MutL